MRAKKLDVRASFGLFWGLVGIVFASVSLRAEGIVYENGSLIDLVTVAGTKATASTNLQPGYEPASFLLRKIEGELRFVNNYGPCWWMMQLPDSYEVAHVRILLNAKDTSVGFQIKVATQEPGDWRAVAPIATLKNPLTHPRSGDPSFVIASVDFTPVKAKFIRVEFTGHNGGENGGTGAGEPLLLVKGLQAWGPNNPSIGPTISVAQSTWAGATCTLHDATMDAKDSDGNIVHGAPQDAWGVVNDNDPSTDGGDHIAFFKTRGTADVPQTAGTASFFVTLKNRIKISRVAYSSMPDSRGERPRDVNIYTSLLDNGSQWTLQKSVKDIQLGSYVEIPFDQPVAAKRVRFEIERVWNGNIDANSKVAEGRMAQLYVYGDPLPPDFSYTANDDGQVSAGIFDKQGQPIRNLQLPQFAKAGTHGVTWDGIDNLGAEMPAGDYECRVVLNSAVYTTAGAIGNTAIATGRQNPSNIEAVAVDSDGFVYTANGWEEAGQDLRKWDRDTGQYVSDDQARIRNGNPNATSYALALDDKYIYCSTYGHGAHGQAHIRRFTLSDETLAPFPDGPNISNGHILLHDDPSKEIPAGTASDAAALMKSPLRAIAVTDKKLFVADYLSSKIWVFDKVSGAPVGSFDVQSPQAIGVDSSGQLWIGHEDGKVTVFSQDGKLLAEAIRDLGQIVTLAFGPDRQLYIADSRADQIFIYQVNDEAKTAVLQRTFGQKAKPADYAADHFYHLRSVAIDAKGYLTVAQNLVVSGCRLSRFAPDGKIVWDQLGGEFCDSGNYAQENPDDVLTQYFHRYEVDKKTGKWDFRGCVLATDPKYIYEQHGAMRLLKLNGRSFVFQGYGTSLQVYREEGSVYRLCSMFGSTSPAPDGIFYDTIPDAGNHKPLPGFWSWHDTNGNGVIDDDEITWQVKPDASFQFSNFGVNVDPKGNALFCVYSGGFGDVPNVTEVPMTGFDGKGNPIYDLSKMRIVVARESSDKPIISEPRMAIRADDDSVYVLGRSKVYPAPPEAGGGWMTGWMLARFDPDGKRLWYTRLPETCPGMDYVPGGGVMLITIKYGPNGTGIYHYNADGVLIGIAYPSAVVLGFSALPDNTGSLCLSRDPRDGLVDVFAEDCVGNRFRWQRMDDHKKPQIIGTWLRLKKAGEPLQVIPTPTP